MDVSDVILKLECHHYLPDWNNKVDDDVLSAFRSILRHENCSNDGRLHLLPGTQVEFYIELEP